MTPKEKAKDIVYRLELILSPDIDNYKCTEAVGCALICVDELIQHTQPACEFGVAFNGEWIREMDRTEYWEQVKQEIEKL